MQVLLGLSMWFLLPVLACWLHMGLVGGIGQAEVQLQLLWG
jgi:hypothetical protein